MAVPEPRQGARTGAAPAAAPSVVREGLGYRVTPSEAPVTFGFSRIVERRDELTAEIHVQTAGERPEHVLRRRINLLGSRAPADLAKDLDTASDGAGWPWRRIIESAFASVVESYRLGEREKLLGGKRVVPDPPGHLIDGLILKNTANTWFGPGGTGKSTAAAAACVAHALGLPFAGVPVERGVPLYLDWEDEEEAFERLLWEVSRGYGLDESARVYWRRMRAPLKDELTYVSALIDRIGATLVVIDSATRAMGSAGEHGTYESTAIGFAEAIRALGKVTTLIIDHVDGQAVKDGGVAKKSYGSIHKMNFVRNAWSLTPDDEADEQTVGWTQTKVNYVKKRPPFGLRYARDAVLGGLELVPVDASEVRPIVERMTTTDQIAAALARVGAMSVKDIAQEVLGETEKRHTEKIRIYLRRDSGKRFRTYSDGTWSLRDWRPPSRPDDAPNSPPNKPNTPNIRIVRAGEEEPDPLPF